MKKQQFDRSQQEIEQEEKKKLDAIIAEKEAWEKWDNSTPRVLEKTIKKLEEMGEQLEKEFAATSSSSSQQPQQPKPKQQQSVIDDLSLEDMMA
jgi:MFS superfamily sulfate permease-like transporter